MNRTYRHVWSKAQCRWVVAAETASSRGGRSASVAGGVLALAIAASPAAFGQIVPTGGNTTVYRAPNGVQVVNINTANPAGLSHNRYTQYNVEATGVVLNNGSSTQVTRNSVLASQVIANLNLVSEARVILNEVVSNNRSVLRGFTEVLGSKADVVLANPWGITCNGCGYINVDRAVLTTGVPQVGQAGTLDAFRVSTGDILVNGSGMDATGPRLLDLVARSVKIDGRITATDMGVTAGANTWTWDSRSATPIAGTGDTPLFAVDSTALGGMYANRIRIVATEAGVGVRMLGEAAASGDDFSLSATGQVTLDARVSAQRNLSLRQTVQTGADAVTLASSSASLVAGQDIVLESDSGGLDVVQGTLAADHALTVRTQSLANTGTIQGAASASLTVADALSNAAEGKILSAVTGGSLSLTAGSIDNAGVIQSKGDLTAAVAGTLAQTSTGRLVTTATAQEGADGNLLLSADALVNHGTVSSAGQLQAAIEAALTNDGTLQATGSMAMAAGGALSQTTQGKLLGENNMTLTGASLINLGLISAGGTLAATSQAGIDNEGTLQGTGAVTLGAGTAITQAALGKMLGDESMDLSATSLANHGLISAGTHLRTTTTSDVSNNGTLQAAGGVDVSAGGALTQSAQARLIGDSDVSLSAASLTNHGLIGSGGSLDATLTNELSNDGTLQATDDILASAAAAINQTSQAVLIGGGTVSLSTASLDNTGRIQAGLGLYIGDALHRPEVANRSGGSLSGDSFIMFASSVLNEGGARMQWATSGSVDAASLHNAASNAVIVGSLDSSITHTSSYSIAGVLDNAGAIHSGGDASITAGAIFNSSTAGISALRDLGASATQSANGTDEALRNEGALYAGRDLDLSAASGTLINAGITGTLDAGGTLSATALNLINQNSIRAQDISLTGTNSFLNQPAGGLPSIYLDENPVSTIGEHGIHTAEYNCNFFGSACDGHVIFESSATLRQRLTSPLPAVKPQILAAGTLTVQYGAGGGANQAGILSANTINISGSGSFTNQDFHLDEITYVRRRTRAEIDCTFCSASYTDYFPANEGQFNQTPGDNGDHITWGNAGVWSGGAGSYRQERVRTTYSTSGAGIFAVTLNFSGGSLINRGSPQQATPVSRSATGGSTATAGSLTFSDASLADATPGAIEAALPTNPNGYFVASKDPNAAFLVETNPLFQVTTDFVGSDYMSHRLGFNPDTTMKRLGDANYEAQLIRQQLISQTGRNLIAQAESESKQMQRLMDNAVNASAGLGLVYGQAPSPAQLAALTGDIVWMVETTVAGQRVLAPVVYLSQATRDALSGDSAGIDATNATIVADTVENTGGTLSGSGSLSIATKGDITNTSGTIKGGNVKLSSSEGSIVNKTLAETRGDDLTAKTNIGKTAGIQATGSLALDAKKDITILGANVSAGQDANLSAGGNVTVDTIVDKTTTSSTSSLDLGLIKSSSNRTVSTEKNIGSKLDVGNQLNIKSGGDTTIAGSSAKAGGDLNVDAGGSFNVLARQDTTTTKTETSVSGLGVGGGLAGSEKTTREVFDGKNVGSTIQAGGNAKINAGKDMVVQGSDVKIAGNADIKATEGIKVLDGLDEQRTTTKVETTTYLKLGSSTAADANAKAINGSGRSAGAKASASASGDIKLAETSVTDSVSGSRSSVASNLSVGGNLNMQTAGTLTVQGSNVAAGGDIQADAKNIEMLAGRNETYASSQTTSKSIGIYSEAEAGAEAKASQVGGNASASAKAETKSVTTVGARVESSRSDEYALKNTASTLTSGGKTSLTAKEEAKFVGADVNAGGALSIKAKDITSLAAQDIQTNSSSMSQQTAGLYMGSNTNAQVKAGNGGGKAGAGAEASAGLRYADKNSSESSGSVTQVTSNFKSGGDISRNAEGKITDQGTQLEAGGDIKQKAREIKEIAADNKTYSNSTSSSNDARIGVYAGAEASADSSTGSASADASVGFKASYEGSKTSESEASTTAVTSRYKAGGSVSSTSTEKTTLIGTKIEAGKDVQLAAGSLDYQAARDTTTKSSSALSGSAEVKVGVLGTAGVNGAAELEAGKSSESSSTARVGGIDAKGNISVKTGDSASFEGTRLKAGQGVSVDAGGNVDFKAARDTSTSSEVGLSVSVAGGTSGSGGNRKSEGGMGVGVSASGSSSDTALVSTIEAGSGGVDIRAGNNARLEGTQVVSGGAASVQAGGKVETVAAKSTSSSYGVSAGVMAGGSSDGKSSKSGGGVGLGAEGSSSSSSQAVNIQSVAAKPAAKKGTGASTADKQKAAKAKKAATLKEAAAKGKKLPAGTGK